jgi:hypothetical protein
VLRLERLGGAERCLLFDPHVWSERLGTRAR